MKRSPAPRIPDTKISATILDFAEPFLVLAPRRATLEQYRQRIEIAIIVWNAVAFETWVDGQFLDEARRVWRALPETAPRPREFWIDLLADRRRRKRTFRDDGRIVSRWEVRPDPGRTPTTRSGCGPRRTALPRSWVRADPPAVSHISRKNLSVPMAATYARRSLSSGPILMWNQPPSPL